MTNPAPRVDPKIKPFLDDLAAIIAESLLADAKTKQPKKPTKEKDHA